MANLLQIKLTAVVRRSFSKKTKLKVFHAQSNPSKFDKLAEEAPRESDITDKPSKETIYDYTKSVRYKVCQDRVPVHKILHTTPTSYEQVRAAINLQSLQPALLPEYYGKSDN